MIAYDLNNNSHVAILVKWWSDLTDEDRAHLFYPTLHKLGPFVAFFNGTQLMFSADGKGINVAAWLEPTFDGAFFSLWVRSDCRPDRVSRQAIMAWKEVEAAYIAAFEAYPVLIGQTGQSSLHAIHLKLGYRYAGCLKSVFKAGPVYFYELTKEAWQNRHTVAQVVRQGRRAQREQRMIKQPSVNGVAPAPFRLEN